MPSNTIIMQKITLFFLLVTGLCNLKAQQITEIKDVALFLHDRVEILDFAGPMEVFIAAGFNVYTVSETKEPIKAMGKLTIVPDYSIEDCPIPDMISFFGGGGASQVAQKEPVKAWMKEVFPQADVKFSVCTGAYFLGEMGLLDGQTATTFQASIPNLRKRFPKANVRDDVRYVDNGTIITTGGISAGIDGALHMVAKILGKTTAIQVADNMEYFGWEPEKGLIIETNFIRQARENGLKQALKNADEHTMIFAGELVELANDLYEAKAYQKTAEVYDYLLANAKAPATDCDKISKTFVKIGRKVPPSQQEVMDLIKAEQYAQVAHILTETNKDYPNWPFFSEKKANIFGYQLLGQGKTKQAIEVFKLNTLAYPNAFNTYDSLGESYMIAEEWDLAVENYKKSIELNPQNDNGRKMIEKIAEKRENPQKKTKK